MAHPADPNCTTCHGNGHLAGCPDCGGDSPAPGHGPTATNKPGKAKRVLKWIAGVLGVLALLALLIWGGSKAYNALFYKGSGDGSKPPPAPTAVATLDPTKPPPGPSPESCGKGTLWDNEAKRCVPAAAPPPTIPTAITVNLPCPSACPPVVASATPPSPTTTASTSPPPPKPAPSFVPVTIDLSKIGDPAVFPGGR